MNKVILAVFGVVCIVGTFAVSFTELPADLQQYLNQCAQKTGTGMEQVQGFLRAASMKESSHEGLCFFKCYLEERGSLEGNKINIAKMLGNKEASEPITDVCKEAEKVEIEECEDLLKIQECLEDKLRKSGLL